VPIIFYGGKELGGTVNARLMAILCVGVAYFAIGVLLPLFFFLSGRYEWPALRTTGLVFSGLAGVAGAVGAICVIFASQAAVRSANLSGVNPHTYVFLIGPLIFGLAPVINTVVSLFWQPDPGNPFHFAVKSPHPLLWVGIVLVGAGAALVLYSKDLSAKPAPKPAPTAHVQDAAPPVPEAKP
ncbi:MAG TPA: hypothetical protein VJ739_12440, partial [Gemmataceae bacterium]|nr:hypothetical protein [Gemmataceae bacterium]